ncbi:Gfo/Idh/MocA family protein [Geminisphaera colitermitum]|uniref:Gfo/Idh/MocA family protein n=1 Tax=Geminisphaera colitermitum TaxID=1148786 RepID=UPI0001964E33|nr:Gfo/Idh/MocA family oxidoreductase [Geminisphaera colitermitum]
MKLPRKLRYGMIGGGRGAFIGAVHRMAAALDGHIELVAGCFSADPTKSRESGADLHLDPTRVYADFTEMARQEAARPAGERLDFVSIVTRNNTHFAIASAFLKAGFNVICEKPVTFNLAEARKLRELVRRSGKIFALTHNYTGYPMVKEARAKVLAGDLGRILKIVVEYPQGYAIGNVDVPQTDAKKAKISGWRANPAVAGASNCIGDIGTHAANLAHYITGLDIDAVCADLTAFASGGTLDDDGNCLLRFKGGARGILYASQISNGDENNLNIRVYGTKASLEWHQEDPNELVVKTTDRPVQILRRGNSYLSAAAQAATRLPFGHPEAFIEAFANVYRSAAAAIADEVFAHKRKTSAASYDFPTIDDGVRGMAFIETAVKSSRASAKWTKFPKV